MAGDKTTGEKLVDLKQRSGLTLDEIAARAGYRGKSSVQEYFKPTYEGPLGTRAASRLADALADRGLPPITREEVLALSGQTPPANVSRVVKFEGSSLHRPQENLIINGTALGGEIVVGGEAIEQTTLNTADIIGYVKRPPILNGVKEAYALHVQGSSMEPVHRDGALLVVRRGAPLRAHDDVVVFLRPQDESDDGERAARVLVKRLLRRTAHYVELMQFNPEAAFRISMDDVLRIDRVLGLEDLLA